MIKNYFKLALRNFLRFKIYSGINLIGLALGLTVGILILLFVLDEFSFDKFHVKRDRIYKVVTEAKGGSMETNAWPVAYKLKTEFPEVEAVVYTRRAHSSMLVNHQGNRVSQEIFYAGEEFLNIFSFNLVEGDPSTALRDPYSMVITQEMKELYFENEEALGNTLVLRDTITFTITGVVENVPVQSHIQFDMLISFNTYIALSSWFSYSEGWGNFNVRNYMLLKEGADPGFLQQKARNIYVDNIADWMKQMGVEFYVDFIPLNDVYLKSDVYNGFGPKGSIDKVWLVSAIGIFIILLACINFTNITTARAVYRAKEVGMRKIIGSRRWTLFWQFMSESFLLTLMAFALVVLLIDLIIPLFNQLMGKNYDITALLSWEIGSGILSLLLIISFLSGYYPAMVLSGFKPAEVLKGKMQTSDKGIRLRRTLVVFQFMISGGLVLGTLLVLNQLKFMRNQDLGFDKEQILVVNATDANSSNRYEVYKEYLKSLSSVEQVSFTNALPGRPGWQGQWAYPEVISEEDHVDTEYMAVDEDYIAALGLEIIAGKNFDVKNPAELDEGVIINETTVKKMGWDDAENALGKKIVSPSKRPEGTVIGVVKDYHGLGLQDFIWPKVMDFASDQYGRYFAIRFTTGKTATLLEDVRKGWKQYYGDYAFNYFFLDQDFDRQYRSEERLMQVFILFAILGVVIASIGLLGLVSFMVLTRLKEIGVRKVLGASGVSIVILLLKEFLILVVIAGLLIIPPVWFFGQGWIENFAYHPAIDPSIFIINLFITVFLAVITVSFQTIRAAKMNPVVTLRNE